MGQHTTLSLLITLATPIESPVDAATTQPPPVYMQRLHHRPPLSLKGIQDQIEIDLSGRFYHPCLELKSFMAVSRINWQFLRKCCPSFNLGDLLSPLKSLVREQLMVWVFTPQCKAHVSAKLKSHDFVVMLKKNHQQRCDSRRRWHAFSIPLYPYW